MSARDEQIAQAEANLALLRGNVTGALLGADFSADGALAPAQVMPEFDEDGLTGATIIVRNGVRYRVTVDYAS